MAVAQTVETVASTDLYEPYAVAVSSSTNVYYFTDSANSRIVRVQPGNTKSFTLADRLLAGPQGLAFTSAGLVVSESSANRISLVTLEGEVTTIAGGSRGSANGAGANAQFNAPAGIAVDGAGNIYVADLKNNSVRKITPAAQVTTYATGFYEPAAVAVGEGGALFVADTRNHQIKMIPAGGGAPVVLAGTFRQPGSDDGSGTSASFNNPRGLLWVGGDTGLVVADTGNHTLRRVFQRGGVWRVATIAGRAGESGLQGGETSDARFNGPMGLALDLDGQILVADLYNNALRVFKRELVATPEITPTSGSYSNSVRLTVKSTTVGSSFRYTTNGIDPTPSSLLSSGAIDLTGGPIALKLRGYSPDFGTSDSVSNNYSFFVATPLMTPSGGAFTNDLKVNVASATEGADLRFTVDGSTPLLSSPKWTDGTISSNVVIRVRGFREGFDSSEVISNRFEFSVAALEVFPAGGTFTNEGAIVVKTATEGVDIRYTSDGSTPTLTSEKWTDRSVFNGPLQLRAFKPGYTPSIAVSNLFRFVVSDPIVSPAGLSSNDVVRVTVSSATKGVKFYYTTDGSDPTAASSGPVDPDSQIVVGVSGAFKVRGFKEGFESSVISSNQFVLKVATPKIASSVTTSELPIDVTLNSETPSAQIYWSIDGQDPRPETSNLYESGRPISLARSGVLKVRAFRKGFVDSDVVSQEFKFSVGLPRIQPQSSTNINQVTVTLSSATPLDIPLSGLFITTDGSDPTTSSVRYEAPFVVATNAVIKVLGVRSGFASSSISSADLRIKTPAPVMSPASGYFPNGTSVSFALSQVRADAKIYYTLDGSEPNETSTVYTSPFTVNQVVSAGQDLRLVRARAFSPNTLPSEIVSGQPVQENAIGIPRDMKAGVGSTIVVPVVINLRTNLTLRSVQFRVEVSPDSASTKPLASDVRALNSTTNDFIRLAGSSSGSGPAIFSTSSYRSGTTSGVTLSAIGTNANFSVSEFGTVAMLAVSIPADSKAGDLYRIRVVQPSGTTNAQQAQIELKAMDSRTITVENIPYLVGDTALGTWYNAGEFGDGNLDNSDVNNAFYASLGIRVPYAFSDVFDAMDAYPDDDDGAVGGDGQIRFLDWQRILSRSLRRDNRNWKRVWVDGGVRNTVASVLGGSPNQAASVQKGSLSKDLWYRQAILRGGVVDQVLPGGAVEVPVKLDVRRGESLAGLQFRIEVSSDLGSVEGPVSFSSAKGMPSPLSADGLPSNQTVASWPLVPASAFTPALQSARDIGYVRFVVPRSARTGQSFKIRFLNPDGAPDLETQYDIESIPGVVWVGVKAPLPQDRISDEWKNYYFGSPLDPEVSEDADSDSDGANNLSEYLAGTNPRKSTSRLELGRPEVRRSGGVDQVHLRWQTVPGRNYAVEVSPSLSQPEWRAVVENDEGDGGVHETQAVPSSSGGLFYRVRLKP